MSPIGPGDVVVCVDASPRRRGHDPDLAWLKLGRAYHVDAVWWDGDPIVLNGRRHAGAGWYADRFRKIDRADDKFIASIRHRQPVTA